MNLLCKIGVHSYEQIDKWTPNIWADIVSGFEQTHLCGRCGKIFHHVHLRWDGNDMVDASPKIHERIPLSFVESIKGRFK